MSPDDKEEQVVPIAETTGAIDIDLELALRDLSGATIAIERAAVEAEGARREALVSLTATLNDAVRLLAALTTVG
jgi:hypothetical protein